MTTEIVKLRVSVARCAQRAGLDLSDLGVPDDADYGMLCKAAETRERGWNHLAGQVADRLTKLGAPPEIDGMPKIFTHGDADGDGTFDVYCAKEPNVTGAYLRITDWNNRSANGLFDAQTLATELRRAANAITQHLRSKTK